MRLTLHPSTIGNAISFGVGVACVVLLWGEARDVPSSSGLSGVPSGQVLTGWIFEVLPRGDDEYEHAKDYVVETICGGLDRLPTTA